MYSLDYGSDFPKKISDKNDKNAIKKKISDISLAIVDSKIGWKKYLILKAKQYYMCTEERCVVSIIINYEDFENVYKKIQKCEEILKKHIVTNKVKMELFELALPDIIYYDINNIHLKCNKKVELYKNYDIDNSCIVIIGIPSPKLNYYYHCTEFIKR